MRMVMKPKPFKQDSTEQSVEEPTYMDDIYRM
jgi:hypothetical protein